MLVVDPARRITVAQIKQHRWMLADPTATHQTLSHSLTEYNSNLGDYSEPVLGIMNALGIDRQRTIEVNGNNSGGKMRDSHKEGIGLSVEEEILIDSLSFPQSLQSSSYNHFSAIYYLLLERVREHRTQQLNRQCGTWNQRPRSTSDSSSPEVSISIIPALICSISTVCAESEMPRSFSGDHGVHREF